MIMCLHICKRTHVICPPLQESTQMSTSAGVAWHRQQHNRTQHNTTHHTTTQHNTQHSTPTHNTSHYIAASCFVIGRTNRLKPKPPIRVTHTQREAHTQHTLETKASHQGGTHTHRQAHTEETKASHEGGKQCFVILHWHPL
jgi:hypothetical protein